MVQPYGPRRFDFGRSFTFNNISVQNNYGGCHGHHYGYANYDTCGLGFGYRGIGDYYSSSRYGGGYGGYYGSYNRFDCTGHNWYGFTRKDYAKMYTLDAGVNLLTAGINAFANYKYEKEANETPEEKELRLANEKQNEIERLRLTNPQTVKEGDNEFTYYYSQKTGYYYRFDASSNSFVRTKRIKEISNETIIYRTDKNDEVKKPSS